MYDSRTGSWASRAPLALDGSGRDEQHNQAARRLLGIFFLLRELLDSDAARKAAPQGENDLSDIRASDGRIIVANRKSGRRLESPATRRGSA